MANENEVEILFHTSSAPKKIKNVKGVYTKGELLCISFTNSELIVKYPLMNIFSICSFHRPHLGSNPKE